MTERVDINLDNFEQLCPLVDKGWKPLYPITRNVQNINIVLTKGFDKFQDKEAEDAAPMAIGKTCRNCVYAHRSPNTQTICLSNQGIPETSPTATILVAVINHFT